MINLEKIEILKKPYPIIIVEDFFEEKFFENIIGEFPSFDEFIKFKKTMVNRRFLSNDNPDFYNYIDKKKSWFQLYNKINNYDFYKKILDLLLDNKKYEDQIYKLIFYDTFYKKNKVKFNLAYYLREITQIIPRIKIFNHLRNFTKNLFYKDHGNNNGVYLRFDISSASNGYFRTPHTDSDGTIFAFLVYLEDQTNIGGSGGDFIINDEKLNIIKSIKPKKNKAIFFLSNKNSYHSVSKICNANGWRKFIYAGFTCTNKKIWSKINDL